MPDDTSSESQCATDSAPAPQTATDDCSDNASQIAATLVTPKGASLFATTQRATDIGHRLFRYAVIIGIGTCLYIVGLKLPAVLLAPASNSVLARGLDPVLAVFVILFSGFWMSVGFCHLWSAWAFLRLRSLQSETTLPTRPRQQLLRGGIVLLTGGALLCAGLAYGWLLVG